MSAPAHGSWLRRVSDVHSGGVPEAERQAVEAHLATCAICQEALMRYQRFYALARFPLRLDGHARGFGELPAELLHATPPPGAKPPSRRRLVAGISAVVAAVLVIAGFVAAFASHRQAPLPATTPTVSPTTVLAPTATPTLVPSSTSSTPAPQPAAFVCANSAGSTMVYAYERGDGRLYVVDGCAQPRVVGQKYSIPLAWSPSNRYLAVSTPTWPAPAQVQIIDVQTGATAMTGFASDFGSDPGAGATVPIFAGWLNDTSYLGAITTVENGQGAAEHPGPSTLVRVDVASGVQTRIGTIGGWVNVGSSPLRIVDHGQYLFYAGVDSSGDTAHLHRVDLTTGTDTTLVSLGLYGPGPCQVAAVCAWTAPWDVSPDGTHILYHQPGAGSTPSDTNVPKDTPVVYAAPDGTGATAAFGAGLAAGLVTPLFSPDGASAVATGSTYTSSDPFSGEPQFKIVQLGGTSRIVTGSVMSWRGDSQALVVRNQATVELYTIATGATTPLEANTNWYLWGN